jgi:hypothetical protein
VPSLPSRSSTRYVVTLVAHASPGPGGHGSLASRKSSKEDEAKVASALEAEPGTGTLGELHMHPGSVPRPTKDLRQDCGTGEPERRRTYRSVDACWQFVERPASKDGRALSYTRGTFETSSLRRGSKTSCLLEVPCRSNPRALLPRQSSHPSGDSRPGFRWTGIAVVTSRHSYGRASQVGFATRVACRRHAAGGWRPSVLLLVLRPAGRALGSQPPAALV